MVAVTSQVWNAMDNNDKWLQTLDAGVLAEVFSMS